MDDKKIRTWQVDGSFLLSMPNGDKVRSTICVINFEIEADGIDQAVCQALDYIEVMAQASNLMTEFDITSIRETVAPF